MKLLQFRCNNKSKSRDENKMPEFNLEMDLGDNGGKISFQTIEEFEQWIAKEKQFASRFPWNQLNQPNQTQQYQSK